MDEELLKKCDFAAGASDSRSRSAFFCSALEHYLAHLDSRFFCRMLSPELEGAVDSRISEVEERLARVIFKLSVELAMLTNITAASCDIDVSELDRLKRMCIDQVSKLGGRYRLEDIVRFQKGGTDS